jgi:hypothetical protein
MNLADMFDTNGWEVVTVGGQERYVTRDENGIARIADGIKRHADRSRRLFAGRPHRRRAAQQAPQAPQVDQEATIVLPRRWEATAPITSAVVPAERPSLHMRIRHAAVDVAIVAISLSGAAIAIKCALWVVML